MVTFRTRGVPSPAVEQGLERHRSEPAGTIEFSNRQPSKRFIIMTDVEIENLEPPEWLVPQMLHVGCLGVLFGPPGVGKSFLSIDWAFRVATGLPWLTGPVKKGTVVYVAAERPVQHRDRVRAWKQANGISGNAGVLFVPMAVDLSKPDEVEDFLAALSAESARPDLVVIDTLARSMVGVEENSAKEMGMFIAGADRIREATGSAVLLVHHGDGKPRGSTALPGASDVMVSVTESKPRSGRMRLRCHKQKTAEEFEDLRITRIKSGESCIIVGDERTAAEPASERETVLTTAETQMLTALHGGAARRAEEWLRRSSVAKSTFYRRLKAMVGNGLVVQETGAASDGAAVELYRLTPDGESHAQTGSK
jgi:hypothetical protein